MSAVSAFQRQSFTSDSVEGKTVSFLSRKLESLENCPITKVKIGEVFLQIERLSKEVPKEVSTSPLTFVQQHNYQVYLGLFKEYLDQFALFFNEENPEFEPFIYLPRQAARFWEYFAKKEEGKTGDLLGKGSSYNCREIFFEGFSFAAKIPKAIVKQEELGKHLKAECLVEFQLKEHPNIMGLEAFLPFEESYLLLYELALGTLRDLVSGKTLIGMTSFSTNKKVLEGIALGLKFLKSQNVIHLDLKARNILMFDDLLARIGDFNLSTRLGGKSLGGSPNISSPEVLALMKKNKEKEFSTKDLVDFSTDVWSFGMLAFFVLSSGASFSLNTPLERQVDCLLQLYEQCKEPLEVFFEENIKKFKQEWGSDPQNGKIVKVMLSCLQKDRFARPSIEDVLHSFSSMKL